MIDLHSHILPGIDDGAASLDDALKMARIAVADGTRILACTPHLAPPKYEVTGPEVLSHVQSLQAHLNDHQIELRLVPGGDIHIASDLSEKLRSGYAGTLAGSRYFLFEPPHDVMPPGIVRCVEDVMASGYIPIVTHPERLRWIESHYSVIVELARNGALVQLTAASITGLFGDRIKRWSVRMLEEGIVDLIASDAHDPKYRKPGLSQARDDVARMLGNEAAKDMVLNIPIKILRNEPIVSRAKAAWDANQGSKRGKGAARSFLKKIASRLSN